MKPKISLPECWRTQKVPVCLVGLGGNGSHMLNHLARIDSTIRALGHPGLDVIAYDPDVVTEFNLGRQAFSIHDLGQPKALVLVNRVNQFYGCGWASRQQRFNSGTPFHRNTLIISCVDNLAARRSVWNYVKRTDNYWMDLGNTDSQGQIVLGQGEKIAFGNDKTKHPKRLHHFFDLFPELIKRRRKKDDGPSCSMREALARQDLFINSTLANYAAHLLWTWLRHGELSIHGYFVNLSTGQTRPIPLVFLKE